MERREALPFLRLPRPLLEDAGASRRSIAAFISARVRAFELVEASMSANSSHPGRTARGAGSRRRPGRVGYVCPRPRAPHRRCRVHPISAHEWWPHHHDASWQRPRRTGPL